MTRLSNVKTIRVQFRLASAAEKSLPAFMRVIDETKKSPEIRTNQPRSARALDLNGAAGTNLIEHLRKENFQICDVIAKIRMYGEGKRRILVTFVFERGGKSNFDNKKAADVLNDLQTRLTHRYDQVTVDYLSGDKSLEEALGLGVASVAYRFLGNQLQISNFKVIPDDNAAVWGLLSTRKQI